MIVYEVKCNEQVLFRSSDVRTIWGHVFELVQGTRMNKSLPPLSYPSTDIALPGLFAFNVAKAIAILLFMTFVSN